MKLFLWFLCLSATGYLEAARIKDIAALRGARNNQLVGYGIVIGLGGSGDKDMPITQKSLQMALKGIGMDFKNETLDTKNAAAVVVSALLPPFSRMGSQLDVNISSIGSASSIEGGNLLMTALKGPDGKIYAMAQGKVVTMSKKGGGKNMVTGVVPAGAILEREIDFKFADQDGLRYHLNYPDFTTATRVAKRINEELGGKYANAIDASTIDILPPFQYEQTPVELLAQIEVIDVDPDRKAKVVINQQSGTVILGDSVQIAPVAIAHGNLKIEVKAPDRDVASAQQPKPSAEELKLPKEDSASPPPQEAPQEEAASGDAKKKSHQVMLLDQGTTIADVAGSLNEMGASSEDLIALIQALKASGALMAEVEVK